MNRVELAQYFKESEFTVGAEIGVDRGIYSEVLCQANPALKLFAVDRWTLFQPERLEPGEAEVEARKRLAAYPVTIVHKYSLDALADFEDRSLDFVYIDAGHDFDNVMQDIIGWARKVRKHGVVAGHDYTSPYPRIRVKLAVDAYVQAHQQTLNVTTETNTNPSWWFRKKWN